MGSTFCVRVTPEFCPRNINYFRGNKNSPSRSSADSAIISCSSFSSPVQKGVDERIEQVVQVGEPHGHRVHDVVEVDVEETRVDDVVRCPADDRCQYQKHTLI